MVNVKKVCKNNKIVFVKNFFTINKLGFEKIAKYLQQRFSVNSFCHSDYKIETRNETKRNKTGKRESELLNNMKKKIFFFLKIIKTDYLLTKISKNCN